MVCHFPSTHFLSLLLTGLHSILSPSHFLPKAPNKLRDYVRRNQPLLEQLDLEVEFIKNTQSDKWKTNATLLTVKKLSSGSSISSAEHPEDSLDSFSGDCN